MTRAFFDVCFSDIAISRVALQLAKYLPSDWTIASDAGSADITVFHIVGRRDHALKNTRQVLKEGHKYAIIQYVLESSRNPNPEEWKELWDNAVCVWSYYDLSEHIKNFYHAPLAADHDKWYPEEQEKKYALMTVGHDYKAECLGETRAAAYLAGQRLVNVGIPYAINPTFDNFHNVSDDEMRKLYNQSKRVAALRRKDGFELIAIEALLCGVRPVMFDSPRYRQWFDGLVEFIPEISSEDVTHILRELIRNDPNPVTQSEIEEVKARFSWEKSVVGFWQFIASRL